MGGYDLDEYEEYDDELEDQEEAGEYEEDEEEEVRMPTQEELEYLELRQKLKESIRKKMKKDSGSGLASSREKKKMPYDNFGSFFGPSQPVIAQRVIQESKSLLENPHLAERVSKPKNIPNKGGSSTTAGSKPRPNEPPRKVDNWAKPKANIQMLKNTRDYSFLLSDDAEIPVPTKNPPKSMSAPKPEAHLPQRPPSNNGRKIISGREERKPLPTSSQMRPKSSQQSQRLTSTSKLPSTSLDSRKQLGRNDGNGPGRPSGQKPLPSKMPMPNKERMVSSSVAKSSKSVQKPLPSRPPSSTQKKPLEHKRDDRGYEHKRDDRRYEHKRDDRGHERRREDRGYDRQRDDRGYEPKRDDRGYEPKRDDRGASRGNMVKKPVLSSKPQINQKPLKPPSSAHQRERLQKKPVRSYDDDDDEDQNAISMIRSMFGYNPNRYRGVNDDDDSDMEAGFDDIMMEEKRSELIAKKEDEEELKKIEEEERRERMRKEARKRKLNQR